MPRILTLTLGCLVGLVSEPAMAEVCIDPATGERLGLSQATFDEPLPRNPLHVCDVGFAFDHSFGVDDSRLLISGPHASVSGSGLTQVRYLLDSELTISALTNSARLLGKSLDETTRDFQSAIRKDVCGSRAVDFARGSVGLELTVRQADGNELNGGERVVLIDLEIDTLKDCEAP
jgi:hypothetical protein